MSELLKAALPWAVVAWACACCTLLVLAQWEDIGGMVALLPLFVGGVGIVRVANESPRIHPAALVGVAFLAWEVLVILVVVVAT